MFRSWTFGRKIAVGFAITVLALFVVAISGYRSATLLVENDELVAHTQRVRRELAVLVNELVNAETGQRGFVITANEEFLEPYNTARHAIATISGDIRQLTIDNPRQTRRLDELRPVIDAKLAELARTIELRRTGSFEATAAVVKGGEGKRAMDQIRSLIQDMDQDEANLLDQRRREAAASTEFTQRVILWGSIAAAVLSIVVAWWLTRALANQVGSAVQHIQSSSVELEAAASQQATGARDQSTAMSEIATTINELLATSKQISDSARRVSEAARQTAGAALKGDVTVARGRDASSTARKQVDAVVAHMLELGKKSQQVEGVLDIVSELAEQTNILAINATIEAVSAGDQGSRFGVVAEEIRKLADRVGASTKEIRVMLEDVRSAVNTTVMATETGNKAVDAGAIQVGEMATAFQEISNLVGTTTDAAREIELSTKQQTTAVEQVNQAIASIATATREAAVSTSQTVQTASSLAGLSSSLLRIVQQERARA